jgi:opacity protein-like surface antigen
MAESSSIKGFYAGGAVGVNILTDSDVEGGGTTTSVDFDTGYAGLGAVGYGFGNGLRLEGEIGYRDNDADDIGSAKAWDFMGNLLYEFPSKGKFRPYIGAGIGAVRTEFEDGLVAGGNIIDDNDVVFGYQGIAGVAVALHERIDLTLDYRYLGTSDSTFSTAAGGKVDAEYDSHTFMVGLR